MRNTDLERNKLIEDLYFNEKLNLTQISNKINISISQISRVLSNSPLYAQEKARRKQETYKRHNEQAKEIMRVKRKQKNVEDKAIMDMLHYQASIELSYFHPLSQIQIRKNCSSAYDYNIQKQRFELKKDMVYSNDMPSVIKY